MRRIVFVRSSIFLMATLLVAGCGGAATTPTAPAPEITDTAAQAATNAPTETVVPTQTSAPTETTAATQTTEPTQTTAPTEVAASQDPCPQSIVDALTQVDQVCSSTSRNQVCYGNNRLTVSPDQPAFANPGDVTNIADIQRLSLDLDRQSQSWGVALMSLQANLPDTLPGQNVTLVLFGNVQFDVADSQTNLQAFRIQTGFGDAPCAQAPDSGLLVQTPHGARDVAFNLNGVDVQLGSTAYFQAAPDADLVTSVIEGAAHLTSQGVTRVVPAGLRSTVPLDDSGEAAGPPSAPEVYNPTDLIRLPVTDLVRQVAIASPLFSSTFDTDAEGWTAAEGDNVQLSQVADEASGNGVVCGTEQTTGDAAWYFNAPDSWLADMGQAYGGTLVYGQDQGQVDNQLDQNDKVLLVSNSGMTLAYDAGQNPAADYTVYAVPLIEAAGWVHQGTNIRATQSEFQQTLADLAALQIMGKYRRGDNTSCLDFALVNSAVQAELSSAPTEPILDSEFDTDAEGWRTNDGGATPIEHFDGGYVCGTDTDFIDAWYFIAPDTWLGDQSAAYGGFLVYELNQSATDGIQNTVPYNVSLTGAGMTLQYQATGNPSTEFTRYIVPLTETAGWLKAGRDQPPTQDEMRQVLSNLEEMRIIGEFRGDVDTGCLNRAAVYPAGWRGY